MKPAYILLLLFAGINISRGYAQTTDSVNAMVNTGKNQQRILIINSFDAMSIKARNNKKELFQILADSLKNYLQREIINQAGGETKVIADILPKSPNPDSAIFLLMKNENAKNAILIRTLDAYFTETGSREIEDSDGKTRNAVSFDLCAKNEYTLYGTDTILKQSVVENCAFFSERTVTGKHFIFAVGPDIVGKKKHTYGIVAGNAHKYISQISPVLEGP